MKIVKVANHACVRVQKMAIPLIQKGHEVHLIAHALPTYGEYYKTINVCANLDQMANAIDRFADADIFHCHNEPSYFVTLIKERFPDKPVILDVHDSYAARMTSEEYDKLMDAGNYVIRLTAEERNNFQLADGLVFPGESFADIVKGEFKLEQPFIILPSMLPKSWYRYNMREYLGGLLYEGRVNTKAECEEAANMWGFKYCEYEDLAKKAHELEMDFHLYTIRKEKEFRSIYKDIAILHEPCNMKDLVKNIARHDWGLVGNVHHSTEWEVAFPNKMFEYIAACVPVVAINAKACGDFLEKEGIGISVSSLEELAARWAEHRTVRQTLIKKRLKYSMDAHIGELEGLYAKFI